MTTTLTPGEYEVQVYGEAMLLTKWELLARARRRNLIREGLPAVLLHTTPEGETFVL